ncbi:hypothetical protein SCLCIDRAFT_34679 [Scleroderma citrinum Foug A]|uniref:Uncharacterized protein n=1 Tax=Scleroderma citrinum Foug A TaxID=1036808 RepID=A0A0C3D1T6_9AGAM|nr:hypothetical protein SCLCIDRAFT_34679 [Scleroderma citrinum Foug A]
MSPTDDTTPDATINALKCHINTLEEITLSDRVEDLVNEADRCACIELDSDNNNHPAFTEELRRTACTATTESCCGGSHP